ncbi:MAG: hypothetical protein AAFV25_25360 [Bacteroidota bacterium]
MVSAQLRSFKGIVAAVLNGWVLWLARLLFVAQPTDNESIWKQAICIGPVCQQREMPLLEAFDYFAQACKISNPASDRCALLDFFYFFLQTIASFPSESYFCNRYYEQ